MMLLALDTATSCCSAAVWRDGAVLGERQAAMERGQSETLAPMIAAVMTEAGAAYANLDGVAVTIGPGAFTGVRIGLSTARALALAAGVPCIGVTTLEAMAAGVPAGLRRGRLLLVVLDAKRRDLYAQAFSMDLTPLGEPAARLPDELPGLLGGAGAVVLAGDASEVAGPLLAGRGIAVTTAPDRHPRPEVVAAIAASRWHPGSPPPRPLYLRAPDVTLPQRR
jgi:tRNA threonylcarbamoyladenosine biosynthesis protein TsaB